MENVSAQQATSSNESVSMTELAAYAGNGEYPKYWEKYHQKKSTMAGFNIWAAVFGLQWFFYRKLYIQGLIAFCLEFVIPVGFVVLAKFSLEPDALQEYANVVGYCAVLLFVIGKAIIGYWANIAFYKVAVTTIQKINKLNLENKRYLSVLEKLGQPSIQSIIFLYIGIAIIKVGIQILH